MPQERGRPRSDFGPKTVTKREPTAEELKIADAQLTQARVDAQGKPLDPLTAKREAYEDLLWALINTKEFLYNH